MKVFGLLLAGALLAGCASAPDPRQANAQVREVKLKVDNSIRSFSRCLAHALDHARPDLRHVAVALADGSYEVRSRDRNGMMMVSNVRQAGSELSLTTHVHAGSPPPGDWYRGVDDGIDECNGGSDHPH